MKKLLVTLTITLAVFGAGSLAGCTVKSAQELQNPGSSTTQTQPESTTAPAEDTTVEQETTDQPSTTKAPETTTEEQTEATTEETTKEPETVAVTIARIITYYDVPLSENLQKHIYMTCFENNVEPAIIYAMISVESEYQTDCYYDGNYGLMQVNKCNFNEYNLSDPYDPYENTRVGITIMGELIKKYGNTQQALMAYNLGEGGAAELWAQDIYDTDYTIKVNRAAQNIRKEVTTRK